MYRTKEDKQLEVKTIITKLTESKLNMNYDPIRELFVLLKMYVNGDKSVRIDISFSEIHRRILGYLPVEKDEECWVKLIKY